MAYYQLPHEVGQKQYVVASGANAGTVLQEAGDFPVGQTISDQSIPVVVPREGAGLPVVIYQEKPTEIRTDLLGNPRAEYGLSLFNYTDDYAYRDDIYVSEIQGLNEVGADDVESAKWAQLQNVGIDYSPLPTGYISHDANRQAVKIELAKAEGGFQRARISTRKRFRYQTGRVIRASVCLQMSKAGLPACEKLWGIGDALDGFFFNVRAGGEGNDFRLIHRRSSGDGLVKEVVVPRSQFNGDKLDGTGGSNAVLDITKNCMYLVEWGWYGASSARFYAFVVDEAVNLPDSIRSVPRGRWVLMHEMLIPDSLNAPSLGTPILPFTIEVTNNGYLVEPQFIVKYGLSLQVDGGESEKAEMYGTDITSGRDIGPVLNGSRAAHFFPLFALRAKDFAPGNLINSLQGLPKTMDIMANYATELVVLRDPMFENMEQNVGHFNGTLPDDVEGTYGIAEALLQGYDNDGTSIIQLTTESPDELPISIEDPYSLTEMGTLEANFFLRKSVSGKQLASIHLAPNKSHHVNLTSIYDLVREAITTEYDSQFDFPSNNETFKIASIESGLGVLTLDRKHTLEPGFRFVIGAYTFYVIQATSEFSVILSQSRGGLPFSNYSSLGIVAGDYGVGYYDLVIANAVASRARPIGQGTVVFAARRIVDSMLTSTLAERDAEWMRTFNCSTTNTYNVVSPAPEVRAFLNYGLR